MTADWLISLGTGVRNIVVSLGISDPFTDYVMTILAALVLMAVLGMVDLYGVYAERRIAGFIQYRHGPNRVGPHGLLQAVADGIKMLSKEDLIPNGADRTVFRLAPYIVFTPAMMVWAVLPFSKYVVAVDLNIGLLYVIAIVSVATLGLLMAGWSSNNKYSLLGAMRSVAQMLSYELPLVFSILGVVMLAGSINLSAVVEAQTRVWFIIPQFLGFIIFIISATAELNRLPFDLVEADSELTAGAFTEYSGMRWGIFFAAEYANIFAVSALATTLFLGGWHGPLLPPYVWFFIKTCTMMFFFIWMRWTFPRLRIDQLLNLSWKVLLPLSILNILLTGTAYFFFFL